MMCCADIVKSNFGRENKETKGSVTENGIELPARPCSANRAQAPSSLFSFPAHESGTYDVITLRITGCAKLEQVQVDRPHVPCASSLSLVALELISARVTPQSRSMTTLPAVLPFRTTATFNLDYRQDQ